MGNDRKSQFIPSESIAFALRRAKERKEHKKITNWQIFKARLRVLWKKLTFPD